MSLLKSLMARGAALSLAAAVAVSCALPTVAALADDTAAGAVPGGGVTAPGTVQVENP